ncbi:MAG: hypothetical protein V4492_02575, partial [Chlamydiota bacterium]
MTYPLDAARQDQTSSSSSPTPPPSRELFLSAATALFAKQLGERALTPPTSPPSLPILTVPVMPPRTHSVPNPVHDQVARLSGTISSLDSQLGVLTGENRHLQEQLSQNASARDQLQQEYDSLHGETQRLRVNLDRVSEEHRHATEQLSSAREIVDRLHGELGTLRGQQESNARDKEALQREFEQLQQQKPRTDAEIKALQHQLEENYEKQQSLQQRCDTLAAQQSSTSQELNHARTQLTQASSTSANTEQLMHQLQANTNELDQLRKQLHDNASQRQNLEQQHGLLRQQLDATRHELTQTRQNYDQLVITSTQQKEENERLKALVDEKEVQIGGLTAARSSVVQEADALAQRLLQQEQQLKRQEEQIRQNAISNQSLEEFTIKVQQQFVNTAIAEVDRTAYDLTFAFTHAHIPQPPAIPEPPLLVATSIAESKAAPKKLSSASLTSSSSSPSLGTSLADARARLGEKKLKSWERTYLWNETVAPNGKRDPLAGLEPHIKEWILAEKPSQSFAVKARIYNWATSYLLVVNENMRGATSFCYDLEAEKSRLIPVAQAKELLTKAFASKVTRTTSTTSSSSSTPLVDDDDDWSDEDNSLVADSAI